MDPVLNNGSKEQLINDFKSVVTNAEALLKATAHHGGDELLGLRHRAEESISAMKIKIADEQAAMLALSKDAAKSADVYVHLYPWTAVGVAAGVGLVVGLLSRR